MVAATEIELAAAGITTAPEVVLADAGYWHQAQMETITGRGTVVLIPPDAGKRKGARPGWDGGPYTFMRRVLATKRGGELYAKRQGMIEPVFAHTSSTAGWTASNAAADRPSGLNGGSSPPPTTCSSSGNTPPRRWRPERPPADWASGRRGSNRNTRRPKRFRGNAPLTALFATAALGLRIAAAIYRTATMTGDSRCGQRLAGGCERRPRQAPSLRASGRFAPAE